MTTRKVIFIMVIISILSACQVAEKDTTVNTGNGETIDLPGTWETLADMPTASQETSITEMNGKLYISGGVSENDFTGFLENILEYDPLADTWKSFAAFDMEIHHHAFVSVGNVLYVIGGYSGPYPGGQMLSQVFAYDAVTGFWEERAALPRAIAAGAAVAYEECIYLFGGVHAFNTGNYNTDVLKYSPEKNLWEVVGNFARTREHMSAVVVENKIYIVGGRVYKGSFTTFSYLDSFDPDTGRWEQLPDIPLATSASLVAVLNGQIFTFGGETAVGPSTFRMVGQGYKFNFSKMEWTEVENLQIHGTQAVTIDGAIYTAGGGISPGVVNALNTTSKFTIH